MALAAVEGRAAPGKRENETEAKLLQCLLQQDHALALLRKSHAHALAGDALDPPSWEYRSK